jgi:hypothetical protein
MKTFEQVRSKNVYKPFIIFNDNRQSTRVGEGSRKTAAKIAFLSRRELKILNEIGLQAELWIGNRELEIDAPRRARVMGYGKGRGSVAGKWKITKY